MNRSMKRVFLALFFLAFAGLSALPAAAQSKPASADGDVLSLIPKEAVFFIEHRGHEAVKEAFEASNLGEMAADDAVKSFVQDSRARIGEKIVKELFNLEAKEDIAKAHDVLHKMLLPYWYRPAAMFVVVDKEKGSPGMGFICWTGKYEKDCREAAATLMKMGVPQGGRAGTRQAFKYSSGLCTWEGVIKRGEEFQLSDDAEKQVEEIKSSGSVFMVSWTGSLMCVATDLAAADAIGGAVRSAENGKARSAGLKAVMAKTAMKDWAFRWYLDAEALLKMGKEKEMPREMQETLAALGVDKIRGVGGTGGFMDKVYTRLTYIDAPGTEKGILKLFKAGGSFQPGFAMVPGDATFAAAGQVDAKVLTGMIREIAAIQARGIEAGGNISSEVEDVSTSTKPAAAAESRPANAATTAPAKLPEEVEKVLKQIEALAEASGGNVGMFVGEFQAMMMGGGPPVGFVIDVKDSAKANAAIEELTKLANQSGGDSASPDANGGSKERPKEYRKVPIRYIGEGYITPRLGVMKDRVVLAMSDTALKAGIDTALDKTGGYAPDSKGAALVKLCGDGAAIFTMDLAALAKLGWPLLMQGVESAGDEFPLASLPSTEKMARMLGPEVVVAEPDKGGLLFKSRGKIPFATKFLPMMTGSGLGAGFMFSFMD